MLCTSNLLGSIVVLMTFDNMNRKVILHKKGKVLRMKSLVLKLEINLLIQRNNTGALCWYSKGFSRPE